MNFRSQTNRAVIDKPDKRPSFLILTGDFEKGGAERRMVTLIKHLCREGFNMHIGAFSKQKSTIKNKLPYTSLTYLGSRGIIPLIAILRILKLISSTQPEIIFCNLRRVNIIAVLVKILSFSNKIVFLLGVSNNPNYHPNSLFTRLLYKYANRLIANSHGTKNYLCNEWGLDEKSIHVIHNGVNSNEVTSLAKDDTLFEWYKESLPIIITVGRLYPQKNHACLIKAFSIVSKEIESRLIIIGEGPLQQSLEKLARSVGVAENTWFAEYQINPYKFLSRSSLFILSSEWEGFPNVLLEAMVCGVPVISTDIDFGPREIINHGETGFLVPNDDPVALAEQIHYVLKNRSEENIKVIINNARKKVEAEFSSKMMTKKYQEYFVEVYNNHYAEHHSQSKV